MATKSVNRFPVPSSPGRRTKVLGDILFPMNTKVCTPRMRSRNRTKQLNFQEFLHFFLVYYLHSELLRPIQLRTRIGSGRAAQASDGSPLIKISPRPVLCTVKDTKDL